ncbi:MAG: beta-phosphoglucomutase [Chitinivibrionales bacterium]|nr:beta-phosphoglucomutase [Chitinivibrionales bacterium]
MGIKGVILDLDGVICTTDEYHYHAWKKMADEEGIYFDKEINERCRGVSRMASLDVILERAERPYSEEEKKELAERKNNYYKESLKELTPDAIFPGVKDQMEEMRRRGIKLAVGSASKNTPMILRQIGLGDYFDAVADGNAVTNSKPDPEVFLVAAQRLGLEPEVCLVVEDAVAGVEAALNGNMKVLAVGSAANDKRATLSAKDLASISVDKMLDADR